MNIPSIACSIEGNSQCGGSGPSCHHCDVQAAICPGKKQLSPAMAHPSAAGAAVLVNGPVDSVGSPMLFQAPGSLFYPILDELPSIAHPMEIFSTRQESLTSYADRSQLGTCSFSIFGTTSSSPVSSSSSHNTSPGYTRLALSRSYRRVRRKETTRADPSEAALQWKTAWTSPPDDIKGKVRRRSEGGQGHVGPRITWRIYDN